MELRRPPHLPLFPSEAMNLGPDALIARVQPDEGVSLRFGAKVPGHEFRIRKGRWIFIIRRVTGNPATTLTSG